MRGLGPATIVDLRALQISLSYADLCEPVWLSAPNPVAVWRLATATSQIVAHTNNSIQSQSLSATSWKLVNTVLTWNRIERLVVSRRGIGWIKLFR